MVAVLKAVDQNQHQRVKDNKSHHADQHRHEASAAVQTRKPGAANALPGSSVSVFAIW